MRSNDIPSELRVALNGACALSLGRWRLKRLPQRMGGTSARLGLRHPVWRIAETLQESSEVVE
jgi:uncharacterized protein (DUF433 family)